MKIPAIVPLDQPAAPKPESQTDLLREIARRLHAHRGTLYPAGAIIANTGVCQQLMPANPLRHYLLIQASSKNAASIWFDMSAPADFGGFALELVPGQSMTFESEFVTSGPVFVNGTAGDKVTAREGYFAPYSEVE